MKLWKNNKFPSFFELIVLITILFLFTSGLAIYYFNKPRRPSVLINEILFRLGENERRIELSVEVRSGSVELKQFFVNGLTVYKWSSDKKVISEGERTRCILEFPWRMGKEHVISLVTVDDQIIEVIERAPEIDPELYFNVKSKTSLNILGSIKFGVNYQVEGFGIDDLQIILFVYRSFERSNRSVYVFYDARFLSEEGLRRADAIIKCFRSFNVTVEPLDYRGLELLSKDMPRAILILVNPLKDGSERRLLDAAPAPLIDPNGNGYIRDDSRYGRSHIYDWMMDKGLILVTVGSNQPYKRILYGDGYYRLARDSLEAFDAHFYLTSASGKESIINGSFTLGSYSPTRISGSLGLSYREESFAFDKDSLERNGLTYYSYGDYKLNTKRGVLNLSLPVFIRVGKGGWLAMGDNDYWLSDEKLSHDLFQIYLQSVWDSDWIPYGWYWDSGTSFHRGRGLIRAEGSLETEMIPLDIIGEKLSIRILGIAYSRDLERGIILERIFEHQVQ
ncbi:MAG: hypothetical protein QXH67_04820 [Candidatus Bathyarchaeia archaeon]